MQAVLDYFHPLIDLFGEHPYIRAGMALMIAFAVANLTAFIVTFLIGNIVKRTGSTLDDAVAAALRMPLYWTAIFIGVLACLILLQLPETATSIGRSLIFSALILIWSFFVIRVLRALLTRVANNANTRSVVRPQTLPLFNNIAVVFVCVLSIYFIFETWNIDMTAWLASAGIVGIAVGFAAKDTLANLFAGVLILADAPYKIGDYVVLESAERGKVTHIGIRSTRILTRDDVEVTIPNSIMGNTRIVNESGGPHEKFRIRVAVGVAYGSDIDLAKQVLLDVAESEAEVCQDPEPRVRFRLFGASALEFELLCWIENPELRGRAVDALNSAIYKEFIANNIEIPYSKHDIYIKEMPGG